MRDVARPGTRSYVVCTVQRTGSTLFCEELQRTRLAGHPFEWFHVPEQSVATDELPESRRERFEAFKCWSATPNGVFGIKLMWSQLDLAVRQLRDDCGYDVGASGPDVLAAALPDLHYIWLRRENTVRQGLSHWRAAATRQYHVRVRYAERSAPPPYDFDAIDHYVRRAEQQDESWRIWFAEHDIEPFQVSYESLIAHREATLKETLGFLGVRLPFGFALRRRRFIRRSTLRRLADESTDQYEETYRADRNNRNPSAGA